MKTERADLWMAWAFGMACALLLFIGAFIAGRAFHL